MPGLTHEQYLDEPGNVIEWMLRIDMIQKKVEREERERRGMGG